MFVTENAWRGHAACQEADPLLFFPENSTQKAAARAICAKCSVKTECLQSALDNNDLFGMWGGLDPTAIRHMRNRGYTKAEQILAKVNKAA